MINNSLIAGILIGGMIPRSAQPIRLDPRIRDMKQQLRLGSAVDVGIRMYQLMVEFLDGHFGETAVENEDIMNDSEPNTNGPSPAHGTEDPVTSSPPSRDIDVIAAIITAAMLPALPIPKLRSIADSYRADDMDRCASIIADALYLYTSVRHVLNIAEGKLPGYMQGRERPDK